MISPCVNVCKLDDARDCVGCGRSVAEIRAWRTMTDGERRRIMDRLARQGFPKPEPAIT